MKRIIDKWVHRKTAFFVRSVSCISGNKESPTPPSLSVLDMLVSIDLSEYFCREFLVCVIIEGHQGHTARTIERLRVESAKFSACAQVLPMIVGQAAEPFLYFGA